MTAQAAILESWRRQSLCLTNLMGRLNPKLLKAKSSKDGWTIAYHLCHIHECRVYWLSKASGVMHPELIDLYHQIGEVWYPSESLTEIREQLALSEQAIQKWVAENINNKSAGGPYDHPILFLQHMVWHEGYHFALLTLALRTAGHEASEVWEEENIWGLWRKSED